jgi:hypothetical protein
MNRSHRDVLNLIRQMGGRNPTITQGGRHTRVVFTDKSGKRQWLSISRGANLLSHVPARNRSQLRRMLNDQPQATTPRRSEKWNT